MSNIDLGFLEKCENWQVESRLFPSKVGGKPAWLSLENVPKSDILKCQCEGILTFLCQIYAPYEEDDANFHRTLFVFICKNASCCIKNSNGNLKVLRSTLKRDNRFYSSEPPEDRDIGFNLANIISLCNYCGCFGDKKCAKCKQVHYCSKEHQINDWKNGHKENCLVKTRTNLFPQWEIVMEAEENTDKTVDIEEELKKFSQMQSENQTGTLADLSEEELDKHAMIQDDKTFSKFKKRTEKEPDQILRYDRGGEPLWIAEKPKPSQIPDCEYCGSERQYEFQIMPQLLTLLGESDLDWGVLVVYTCKNSCNASQDYRNEYVFKQDIE